MSDEMVDVIDDEGKVVGKTLKVDAHKDGQLHKTVIGCVKDGDNWLLVRQSALRQDAGQFVNPVGGHVRSGESDLDALKREAKEEIGVDSIEHKYIGRVLFHRHVIGRDENHMFEVYEMSTRDMITLNHEADLIRTFKPDELKKFIATKPHEIGDAFYVVLEKFYPEFLPVTWIPRWS